MEIFFFLFIAFIFWLVFAGKDKPETSMTPLQRRAASQGSEQTESLSQDGRDINVAPPTVWETTWREGQLSNGRQSRGTVARLTSHGGQSPSTLPPKARPHAAKAAKLAARMAATRVGTKLLVDDRNASRQTLSSKRVPQIFSGKNITAIIGLSGLGLYVLSQF